MTRLLAVALLALLAARGAEKTSVSALGVDRPGFLLIVVGLIDGSGNDAPVRPGEWLLRRGLR